MCTGSNCIAIAGRITSMSELKYGHLVKMHGMLTRLVPIYYAQKIVYYSIPLFS